MTNPYKILIKYPSRSRPERFFQGLESIYLNIADTDNFHVACTFDDDDVMVSGAITDRLKKYKNLSVQTGISKSKIHAINRDIPKYDFDILICMSDDMRFTFYGFDQIIRGCFDASLDTFCHIPDFDEKNIPTLYVAGRAFYDRMGYIYDPAYKSLFCDVELADIAKEIGKYRYFNIPGVFSHLLPAYGHLPADEMWNEQQRIGWTEDQKTYLERKAKRLSDPDILKTWIDAYPNNSQ